MGFPRASGYIFGIPLIVALAAAAWLPHARMWPLRDPSGAPGAVSQMAADVIAPEPPSRAHVAGPFSAAADAGASPAAPGVALSGDLSSQSAPQWWSVVADIGASESAAVFTAFCGGRNAAWLATVEQQIAAQGLRRLEELHPTGISSLPDFVAGIIAGARGLSGAGWELGQPHSWRDCAPAVAPSVKTLEHHG